MEVIVSVALVVALGVPLTTFFYSALHAASTNAGRQDAAALAGTVLSELSSGPYGQVGFTASQLNAAITADPAYGFDSTTYQWNPNGDGGDTSTEQLVTVATGDAPTIQIGSPAKTLTPIMSGVLRDGQVFSVMTHVVAVSSLVPACPGVTPSTTQLTDAYARVFVNVSWGNGGTLEQDSEIYPGGLNPYRGPQFQSGSIPSSPSPVSATATGVTGEIKVSWTASTGDCVAVGWADTNQEVRSTGLLPTSVTTSYTVSGLAPGGTYVFFVTAYSANGVESTESADSPAAVAPNGPLVNEADPDLGPYTGGTVVTLTGANFSTPTMAVQFGTGGTFFSANCASSTSCTVTAPAGTGVQTIVAETPTGPGASEVTSPPLAADQFSYMPSVTGVTPASGAAGASVTVTGTNLISGTTFTFGTATGSPLATGVTCNAGGTSCKMTVPAGGTGTVDVIASNGGGTALPVFADQFTYS